MLKTSFYNMIIPVQEKNVHLVYNTRSNSLLELEPSEAQLLYDWRKAGVISSIDQKEHQHFISALWDNGIVVRHDLDEKEDIHQRIIREREWSFKKANFYITITPTLSCNMGCSYCFEGEKPWNKFMKDKTIDGVIEFLHREINSSKLVEEFEGIKVTWFGGEPLLRPEIIDRYSEKLIEVSKQYGLLYSSSVITNGVNLTSEVWEILLRSHVEQVQVTLDGYRDTHNMLRPIVPTGVAPDANNDLGSYDLILDNLSNKPQSEIFATIRINTDKVMYPHLEELLDDLERRGIWPQRHEEFSPYLAFKEVPYEGSGVHDSMSQYYHRREFARVVEEFRELKWKHYNVFAETNDLPKAKKEFKVPKATMHLCGAASHPYSMVIDPDGYIQQCWEYANDPNTRSHHITDEYNIHDKNRTLFTNWDQFTRPICRDCKILPVCEMTCPHKDPPEACPDWKYSLKWMLRDQYLHSIDRPDDIQSLAEIGTSVDPALKECEEL